MRRRAPQFLASAAPYLIGIPLMVAIPAAGILAGLRIAHDPKFARAKTPMLDPLINAGFLVMGAFFTAVQKIGLLAAIGIAAVLGLAIFLLCAKLLGWLLIVSVRGDRAQPPAAGTPHARAPIYADQRDESEPAAVR
jgi:hypothetical protein